MGFSGFLTVPRTIALGFLLMITVGAALLCLPICQSSGDWGAWLPALFTSTSAVCVTGLSVVDVGTYFSPAGQGVLMLLVQVGGLGYMTMTSFLLALVGYRFRLKDKVAIQGALDVPGLAQLRQLVLSIIGMTVVLELSGTLLLMTTFVPEFGFQQGTWHALFHSVSAFNNAGFGLFPDNLMRYVDNPTVNIAITGLIILGGIGYKVLLEGFLWLDQRRRGVRRRFLFSLHTKMAVLMTAMLLLGGFFLLYLVELHNPDTLKGLDHSGRLWAAWFQSVTTRTAGFNTIDILETNLTTQAIMIALMFVGASPGSTGGGIKTTTMMILLLCTRSILRGKEQVIGFGREIPMSVLLKAVGLTVGSMMTVILSTVLLSLVAPTLDFIQMLFEVVSAFGTVGLDLGVTGKANDGTQLVLIATMYVGRIGVLILMASIMGDPRPSALKYPEEGLLVG
jgi:trk system potassium uptake protein